MHCLPNLAFSKPLMLNVYIVECSYLSHMGQPRYAEVSEEILKYLKNGGSFATPNLLIKELYPIFKSRYPDLDTFRRLIHRNLNHLIERGLIIVHPLRSYYCLKGDERLLNYLIRRGLRHGKLNLEDNSEIIDANIEVLGKLFE